MSNPEVPLPPLHRSPPVALVLIAALSAVAAEPPRQKDLSTPKSAAKSFYAALHRGDGAAARAAMADVPAGHGVIVDAKAAAVLSREKLRTAALKRFGLRGAAVVDLDPYLDGRLDLATERATKNGVTLELGGRPLLNLKRQGKEWRVIVPRLFRRRDPMSAAMEIASVARALDTLAEEVRTGKFSSAAEVRQAREVREFLAELGPLKLRDRAPDPAALKVDVAVRAVLINGTKVPLPCHPKRLVEILGPPTRVSALKNIILTWDGHGVYAYMGRLSRQVSEVCVLLREEAAWEFSPGRTFSGTLRAYGAGVTASSKLDDINAATDGPNFEAETYGFTADEAAGAGLTQWIVHEAGATVIIHLATREIDGKAQVAGPSYLSVGVPGF